MAKSQWSVIEEGIVQGTYEFKDKLETEVQTYFPGQLIVNVTEVVPQPGPGWTYDGVDFTPPPYVPPPFDPQQAMNDIVGTIDFTKLEDDIGKALICIMYALNILTEEV